MLTPLCLPASPFPLLSVASLLCSGAPMKLLLLLLSVVVAMAAVVAAHDPHPLALIAVDNTRVDLMAGATITLHAAGPLKGVGQNVQVSWSGMTAGEAGHWIGIFSPPPANFSKALPTKYHTIDPKASSGRRTVWLLNQRAPTVAVFFRGGLNTPIVVAMSNQVEFASYAEPMHLHLALTRDPAEMRVSWTSNSTNNPIVRWGMRDQKFTGVANANTTTYTARDMCGAPATGIAFRVSRRRQLRVPRAHSGRLAGTGRGCE